MADKISKDEVMVVEATKTTTATATTVVTTAAIVEEVTTTKTTVTTTTAPSEQLLPSSPAATANASSTMPPVDATDRLSANNSTEDKQASATTGAAVDSSTPATSTSENTVAATNDNDDDNDDEVVVTLDEVLRQDAILTETANAVLGASSETDCSYALGYIRQALYACLTCTPATQDSNDTDDRSKRAGICLACSYNCHEGHELIELYTKRHFRCDCGNSKFPPATPCKLEATKAPVNDQNVYSHNFAGAYCTCNRPYPDPQRPIEHGAEVMLQCVVCEDWLHAEHVFPDTESSNSIPDDFDDFICVACMTKHPFLFAYDMDDDDDDDDQEVEVPTVGNDADAASVCTLAAKLAAMDASDDAAPALQQLRPTFWSREWRDALCKCRACIRRFEVAQIAFLLDTDDSLQAYEEAAAAAAAQTTSATTPEDLAQRAFASTLSHQQQVEMAIGYSHMKHSLQGFLGAFAAGNKTVRAEDIQSFFAGLKEQKRQKTMKEDDENA